MNSYKADLHIHTVLSPCGDLDMSPKTIVDKALAKGLDIIGITDHNSTKHCKLIKQIAEKEGVFTLMGAEVTTKEEVHCLAFFENFNQLDDFQKYIETFLPPIENDVDKFGYQAVVDENEDIIELEKYLLLSGLNQSIDEVEQKVHSLNGLFIPAHIDRPSFSISSQLGFIPFDLNIDAFEVSAKGKIEHLKEVISVHKDKCIIRTSDAHYPNQIGEAYCSFIMQHRTFEEIRMALKKENGRTVILS